MGFRENLLETANAYCIATNRARSGVALLILNDSKFFDRLETGCSCTIDTYEKVMKWFKEHMPAEAPPPQPSEKHRKRQSAP